MPEQVFDAAEQDRLARSLHHRPYAGITKDQLVGLLQAVSNYFTRIPLEELPPNVSETDDPAVTAAHHSFSNCWQKIVGRQIEIEAAGRAVADAAVFDSVEQEKLRLDKYLRYVRRISHDELIEMLEALDKYADVAPRLELLFKDGLPNKVPIVGFNRFVHAHNALVEFRRTPFTGEEFADDLYEKVLSPQEKSKELPKPWWRIW